MLYPLKFTPIYKERIWGGNKLSTLYGRDFSPMEKVGESWEISGLEDDLSVVSNGFLAGNNLTELLEVYMGDLVGESIYEEFGNTFPLLVKLLDASEDLSIQVHPDDNLAIERHKCYGKTEFWYVLQADPEAKLISGFSTPTNKETYLKHLENNTIDEIIKWHDVYKGDVFFIPSGRIHAIGKGNVILEIQQTSDITYRIFDYNRLDANGDKRELHTENALDAINFDCFGDNPKHTFGNKINNLNKVIHCDFFDTNYIKFDETVDRDYYQLDSFVIYVCISGSCNIEYDGGTESIKKGETVLIPAELTLIKLIPNEMTEIMEVYISSKKNKDLN